MSYSGHSLGKSFSSTEIAIELVNEKVLQIPESSSITGTTPSDCLVSYPGHSLGESYSSAEIPIELVSEDTLHTPKPQHYWSLTIRLFCVILRTLIEGFLPQCSDAVCLFYNPNGLGCVPVEVWWQGFVSYLPHPTLKFFEGRWRHCISSINILVDWLISLAYQPVSNYFIVSNN